MLMKFEFYRQISEKYSKHEMSLKSVRWDPSCSMREDGRTDMTMLTLILLTCRIWWAPNNARRWQMGLWGETCPLFDTNII